MKVSKFTDAQIINILKKAENGIPVAELCREHGISSATFYKWRSKFGGMDASLMNYVKQLEDENRRLKKMYAEERLKAEIVTDALKKSGEAIAQKRDGQEVCFRARNTHQNCLCSVWNQRDMLSPPRKALD